MNNLRFQVEALAVYLRKTPVYRTSHKRSRTGSDSNNKFSSKLFDRHHSKIPAESRSSEFTDLHQAGCGDKIHKRKAAKTWKDRG